MCSRKDEAMDEYISLNLHREEWEYILSACEQMSCRFTRTDYMPHCCDLNDVVPTIRALLGVVSPEGEGEEKMMQKLEDKS